MATLDNVNLIVRDLEASQRFYQEVLGLTEDLGRSAPPSFVMLRAGEVSVSLQSAKAMGQSPIAGTNLELGFAVDDIEATLERLERLYPAAYNPVQQMGWGRAIETTDPDGNKLNLYRFG